MYVDDLLSLLDACSAPLWATLLVVLLLVLRVPMSWHKACLGPRVVWIGWSFDFSLLTATMDPEKRARLLELLRSASVAKKFPLKQLERLTGKLLWLSGLHRSLRPTLATLYRDGQACSSHGRPHD